MDQKYGFKYYFSLEIMNHKNISKLNKCNQIYFVNNLMILRKQQ